VGLCTGLLEKNEKHRKTTYKGRWKKKKTKRAKTALIRNTKTSTPKKNPAEKGKRGGTGKGWVRARMTKGKTKEGHPRPGTDYAKGGRGKTVDGRYRTC